MTEEMAISRYRAKKNRNYPLSSGICIQCKEVFYCPGLQSKGYCSMKCVAIASSGPNGYKWKGGRFVTFAGYISAYAPWHPRANGHKRVMEHILVMEKHLGRRLNPNENIHNKNGIRNDNRIENLELWAKRHPPGQRVNDLLEWVLDNYSKEIRIKLEIRDDVERLTNTHANVNIVDINK